MSFRGTISIINQEDKDHFLDTISKDFQSINFQKLQFDYDQNTTLAINLTTSQLVAKETISKIIQKSAQIVCDHFVDTLVPQLQIFWIKMMKEELLSMELFEPDLSMVELPLQGLGNEEEPKSQFQEHWRRFIIGVGGRKEQQYNIENSDQVSFTTSVKYQTQIFVSSKSSFNSKKKKRDFQKGDEQEQENYNFIDMGIPQEDNPMENGMRLAYERELELKIHQEQTEKQRLADIKEQQKQLRSIGTSINGKKAYTFDFEGKIMIQNQPKVDKLAPTQYKLAFDVSTIDKYQQFEYAADKQEKNQNLKKKDKTEFKIDKELQKLQQHDTNISSLESIILNKGVTLYEGNAKKTGPNNLIDNFKLLEERDIHEQLGNPGLRLKLSKSEYNSIVSKGIRYQDQTSRKLEKIERKIEVATEAQNSKNIDSINLSQLIRGHNSSMHDQYRVIGGNNSLNSTLINQRSGSIKILNDASIENLFVNDNETQFLQPKKQLPNLKKKGNSNPNEDFNLSLMASKDWGSNTSGIDIRNRQLKYKLPQQESIHYSLPKLPKNPRDRLSSIALNSTNAKRFPLPPNVGKIIGHTSRGFKL